MNLCTVCAALLFNDKQLGLCKQAPVDCRMLIKAVATLSDVFGAGDDPQMLAVYCHSS